MILHQFVTITDLDLITEFDFLPNCTPRGDAGGLSREYVLRIPSVS